MTMMPRQTIGFSPVADWATFRRKKYTTGGETIQDPPNLV